ncbi:uncharacterized protein LOC110924167 [Helianthus annuus]|uniref:uncharacterized protein LOC110924167 n=1 Tax=Helianthus annuus TaxID=4232 RepID=UPI000B8FACE6|nr:uncharacterized protein LOC110924167 [Helianthus annuus]
MTEKDDQGEPSVTLVSKLDASVPLYLHASDSSSLTIVSVTLKGTGNYVVWSNAMKLALTAKNKLGFIDGTCTRSTKDDVLAGQWDRCNSVVLTWILNSVSEELYVGQVYSRLSWSDLKDTYDRVEGSVVFGLYQKINSVSQNRTSVSEYYHRLNTMWKQFDAMVQLPSCTCVASTRYIEFSQLIKLMQFLMGLDDVYDINPDDEEKETTDSQQSFNLDDMANVQHHSESQCSSNEQVDVADTQQSFNLDDMANV